MDTPNIHQEFLNNSSLLKYNSTEFEELSFSKVEDIVLLDNAKFTRWLNTYGNTYSSSFSQVIKQNKLDDFLSELISDEHSTKVIELENLLFVAIELLTIKDDKLSSQQMYFTVSNSFIWSIQEQKASYFEWIRNNIRLNKALLRTKKADYLFFRILDSIIDSYEAIFSYFSDLNDKLQIGSIKPNPKFMSMIESRKQQMHLLKSATRQLRDIIVKLENNQTLNLKSKYYNELKEQSNNLSNDIDFELQELDSKVNLLFNLQGHYLNEIMKTLTIFSVIFIPLTFIAGVYGMNFENMPELKTKYGYFISWGAMLLIALFFIWYFKRKKWF